jgi:hypothetical protein
MSQQNWQLMKWQVDKMACSWNDCQWNGFLMKWKKIAEDIN